MEKKKLYILLLGLFAVNLGIIYIVVPDSKEDLEKNFRTTSPVTIYSDEVKTSQEELKTTVPTLPPSTFPTVQETQASHEMPKTQQMPEMDDVQEPLFPVNINTATVAEIAAVPGVGEFWALQIVELRGKIGFFTTVYELLYVDGIGEDMLSEIAPYITVG
ncbi:MAG: helix-hairpin-helix domain-containing protein [Oscillospiraceae bacterium]|jgi:competence ComEA-like helix-hairpin-helix protein|nr:helix-hairpin-helix domain-containing protein [Oscillospiraceae bacterium]